MKRKNTTWILTVAGIAATTLVMQSCGGPSTANGEEQSSMLNSESASAESTMSEEAKDQHFMDDATTLCLEQIDMGNLAIQKSNMKEVKELGALMVKDHANMLVEIQDMAAKKSITIPKSISEADKKDFNTLSEKYGQEFDKSYCDRMVRKHREAVNQFERASEHAADTDIKAWASNSLPMMRNHLDQSISCQKKCDKVIL